MSDAFGVLGPGSYVAALDSSLVTHYRSLHPSGIYGFRPHLQRRDREGLAPSSLAQESQCAGTLGEERKVVKLNTEHPLTAVLPLQYKNCPRQYERHGIGQNDRPGLEGQAI